MSGSGIMKDGEESIPVKTAISRWADRAFKAEAEIDRLRAEKEELAIAIREWRCEECDCLRAEKAELMAALEDCFNTWFHDGNLVSAFGRASAVLAKTAKEGE